MSSCGSYLKRTFNVLLPLNVSKVGNRGWRRTVFLDLAGFIRDVAAGARENNGFVLQSDLERLRLQKLSFFTAAADSAMRPYLEIIYSLPVEFER